MLLPAVFLNRHLYIHLSKLLKFDGFDWDAGNREKCQKHGLDLEEIEALVMSGPAIYPDHEHSSQEDRVRPIGRVHRQSLGFPGIYIP